MPLFVRPASNRQTARHQDFFARGIRLPERHCRPLRHLPCKVQTQSRLRNRRSRAPSCAFPARHCCHSAFIGSAFSSAKLFYSPRFSPLALPASAKLDPSPPRPSNFELIAADPSAGAALPFTRRSFHIRRCSFTAHGAGSAVSTTAPQLRIRGCHALAEKEKVLP
jgi:hypothetical protein